MFAVLQSFYHVHPIVRASWRLQTTFLSLSVPSAFSIYFSKAISNGKHSFLPPVATAWSGVGYGIYNVGLCIALANTSLLRASVLSQCAPLFIVLYKIFHDRCCRSTQLRKRDGISGVHWKHVLGVILTLAGTGVFISSTQRLKNNSYEEILERKKSQGSIPELTSSSQFIGDVAAAAASIGYATYILCGQIARRSVPVYIHLPGCVFVAMVLVSICCFVAMDVGTFVSLEPSMDQENAMYANGRYHFTGATSDFCSGMLGWSCPQYLSRAVYLGVVCGAIAVGSINWSLNHVSALQAAAANSAEPIVASIIGIFFFSEPVPSFVGMMAAGIIILAMLLCSADDGSNKKIENNDTVASNFKSTTPQGRKMMFMLSAIRFLLFLWVLVEIFLIYYFQDHIPLR